MEDQPEGKHGGEDDQRERGSEQGHEGARGDRDGVVDAEVGGVLADPGQGGGRGPWPVERAGGDELGPGAVAGDGGGEVVDGPGDDVGDGDGYGGVGGAAAAAGLGVGCGWWLHRGRVGGACADGFDLDDRSNCPSLSSL